MPLLGTIFSGGLIHIWCSSTHVDTRTQYLLVDTFTAALSLFMGCVDKKNIENHQTDPLKIQIH